MKSIYYGPDGTPISLITWARLYGIRSEGDGFWTEELSNGRALITVYIGHDENEVLGSPPAGERTIYHTVLRVGSTYKLLETYPTLDRAMEGHRQHVTAWTRGTPSIE